MTPYSIVRIQKLKSWGAVAGAVSHNARTRETLNADPLAIVKNRFLIGSPNDDPVAVCKARLGNQKIRKNAVYGVDGFLGASPEYFRPDAPDQYGLVNQDRLDAWVDASINWLKDQYGDRIINAVLHLDEATPHIQFLLLPLDDKGKLNCRALFGGKKYVLSQLQSDYAQVVSHLGLRRGREGSKANHTEVAEYYTVTKEVKRTSMPELPTPEDIQPPEPPGAMARMKTENLISYGKEAGAQAVADQMAKLEPVLETLTSQNNFLLAENARLKQEREQLKESNSRLNQITEVFKAEAKRMRELDLDKVLVQMFGAEEAKNSTPKSKNRIFTLPDGLTIEYSGNQWRDPKSSNKGKGAINLVMHLSGYGQDNYQQAVRDLAEVFSDKDIANSLATHLAGTAPRETMKILRQKYEIPKPCERTWPGVYEYLTLKMKLPAAFIDKAHDKGLIFSDPRGNCVFARDKESGVFKVGTGDKPFNQTLGKDGEPFFIPGTDDKIYITDSPLDALTLKAMYPNSAIMATGGYMPIDKIKPYTDQREVIVTMNQSSLGKEMAKYLIQHLPKAKCIQPDKGQSWNECWKLQLEKRARDKQIPKQQQHQVQTSTLTQERPRPTGLAR